MLAGAGMLKGSLSSTSSPIAGGRTLSSGIPLTYGRSGSGRDIVE